MNRTRQQGLGVIIIALVFALGQLPVLTPVVTTPAVSVFDRAVATSMLLGALSLFTLGVFRIRNPEWFDDGSTEQDVRPLPMFIIAGGLVGIGVLVYMIAQ
jgi:hypothetical protein